MIMMKKKLLVIVFVCAFCLIPSLTLAKVNISIKMQGGLNYIGAGDANAGIQGFFDWGKTYFNPPIGGEINGVYKALHLGYEFGGDLIFELNRNIGIGIGAGYLRSFKNSIKNSAMYIIDNPQGGGLIKYFSVNTKLSAIPVRLGLFLTLPMGRKINFTANAGASYYLKARYSDDWFIKISFNGPSIPEAYGNNQLSTVAEKKKMPIGFQAGLGIEYKFFKKMSFFVEAQGRYAKFQGLEGTSVMMPGYFNNIFAPFSEKGKLYYAPAPMLPLAPKLIMVQATPPAPGPNGETYEAIVDFSGVSLQAGIRIHF